MLVRPESRLRDGGSGEGMSGPGCSDERSDGHGCWHLSFPSSGGGLRSGDGRLTRPAAETCAAA